MFSTNGPTKASVCLQKNMKENSPFGVYDLESRRNTGEGIFCKSVNDLGGSALPRDFIVDLLIRLVGFFLVYLHGFNVGFPKKPPALIGEILTKVGSDSYQESLELWGCPYE